MRHTEYIVSACLAGFACRFDGASRPCEPIIKMYRDGKVKPICPESLSGLPVPRNPCEKRDSRFITKDNIDVTDALERGAEKALKIAMESGATKAILKARSPSCGVGEIYDGTFTKTLCAGNGLWSQKLLDAGFEVYTEDNFPLDSKPVGDIN